MMNNSIENIDYIVIGNFTVYVIVSSYDNLFFIKCTMYKDGDNFLEIGTR